MALSERRLRSEFGAASCFLRSSMSAFGHKRTYAVQRAMSALPPKADMCSATKDVRYGPKADMAHLFDNLVGAGEQR